MLTKEQILAKCQGKTIEDIRNINLWGCDLENVDVVAQFPNVEIISLSLNNIASLKPFGNCPHLRELYLRKNKVADINELSYLTACKELKILWLEENPICLNEDYRSKVLITLPKLVKLDNVLVELNQEINDKQKNDEYDNVEQEINPRDTITSDIQRPLRTSHSAMPKQMQTNNIIEDDFMKKFDNIEDIKNMFAQETYKIGPGPGRGSNKNINAGLGGGVGGVNVAHSNPISTTLTNMTMTTGTSNNHGKKDYLVSETLLNAQQMKIPQEKSNNYLYPTPSHHDNPVKAFNNYNQPSSQQYHQDYATPKPSALNLRNNQYGNDKMNYNNFKQVPINQEVPFEAKLAQYRHNLNPIPINDSLSNISPRNYHLMTAILNLIEDLSVKELAYVRSKIVHQLNSSNHP